MSLLWTAKEDILVRRAYRAGMKDSEISAFLAEKGFSRSVQGIKTRRLDFLKLKAPVIYNHEPGSPEGAMPDYKAMDDAFCAALREHHPETEMKGCAEVPSRRVPFRSLPTPVFSSTGIMSF